MYKGRYSYKETQSDSSFSSVGDKALSYSYLILCFLGNVGQVILKHFDVRENSNTKKLNKSFKVS